MIKNMHVLTIFYAKYAPKIRYNNTNNVYSDYLKDSNDHNSYEGFYWSISWFASS